jgi:predicted nucleotidyltransferase
MKIINNDKAFDKAIETNNVEEFKELLSQFRPPAYLPHTLAYSNLEAMAELLLESIKVLLRK